MATTSRPITELVAGIRDTAGAVVASGKCRFYQPGTLVAQTVYSDAACSSAISMPYTLNAAGQGTVYTLEAVRMIVKDSTESTTYYDDIANLNRHDAVYVTSSGINGGAETTLETVLFTATTALGAGFQYKESSGATARNYVDLIGAAWVSVKDFGAVGDGTTDDTTAIQAASDRVKARGGGWVLFEKGTYKITSAITVDTVGVCWRGNGRTSIIKNFSTSGNAVSINVGSAIDSKIVIRDLAITANTTSSGKGIVVTNGNRVKIESVAVGLHRTAIDASAVSEATVLECIVESTDDNAAAVGITVGTRGRVDNCNVISATTTSATGIALAGDARAIDSYVEKFATAVSLATAGAQARGVLSSLATTAFSLGAASTIVEACFASGAGTGFSVGAFATCSVELCRASACTTDLSVSASATKFTDRGNAFAGTVTNSSTTPPALPLRTFFSITTVNPASTPTVTPDISGGKNVQVVIFTGAAGTVTIAAHATATLAVGDWMLVHLFNNNIGGNATISWNAQYKDALTSGGISNTATFLVATQTCRSVLFQWDGTQFMRVLSHAGEPV